MNRLSLSNFIPIIVALPAIIIGAIAMLSNKVSIITVGQNIVCLIILGLISCFLISRKSKIERRNSDGYYYSFNSNTFIANFF